MKENLLQIINEILTDKGKVELTRIDDNLSLRNDLEFDSLNLAELTVRIEDEFDVDIFEDGIVDQLSEVIRIIKQG